MPATQKQMDFIDSLANELGMNRAQRNDFISNRVGWEVHYLDELAVIEASNIIDAMLDARLAKEREFDSRKGFERFSTSDDD